MDRKNFLRTGCSATLAIMLGGGMLGLEGCATLPVVRAESQGKWITIPVSRFTETPAMVVRNSSLEFDLLVMKKGEGSYQALQMRCTHFSNALVSGNSLTCPMHGSTFSLEGKVTNGPAEQPLSPLATKVEREMVMVMVEDES
jgi:nitrite reductase/ring-hydroxylating ferredoxin subunit